MDQDSAKREERVVADDLLAVMVGSGSKSVFSTVLIPSTVMHNTQGKVLLKMSASCLFEFSESPTAFYCDLVFCKCGYIQSKPLIQTQKPTA